MEGQEAGSDRAQSAPVNALGDPSSSCEPVADSQHLFNMCEVLRNQSLILRRDAMEIRAKSNEVRLRARTLRR